MRSATVQILSDATNAAVIRHPDRKSPGILVQGDSLHALYAAADAALTALQGGASRDALDDLQELRDSLRDLLEHYKATLEAHGMALPFADV